MAQKVWTVEEVKYLLDNYEDMNNEKLGQALGRSAKAVCFKHSKLTGGRGGNHKYNKYDEDKDNPRVEVVIKEG